jgi:hypothetical protein
MNGTIMVGRQKFVNAFGGKRESSVRQTKVEIRDSAEEEYLSDRFPETYGSIAKISYDSTNNTYNNRHQSNQTHQ